MGYLETVYKDVKPTKYVGQLVSYLCHRYQLRGRLLEVGCGLGFFLDEFAKYMEVEGIDIEGSFRRCDAFYARWPFPDHYFDIVYHKSFIEHGFSSGHIMSETLRVLKPGGRTIILTPDWTSQRETFWEDPTHMKPYTVKAIRDLLLMNGFKDVEVELFYQLPLVWKYPMLKRIAFVFNILSVPQARRMGKIRWMRELMVLGSGTTPQ